MPIWLQTTGLLIAWSIALFEYANHTQVHE